MFYALWYGMVVSGISDPRFTSVGDVCGEEMNG